MIALPLLSILCIRLTFVDLDDTNEVSFRLNMYNNPEAFYFSNNEDYGNTYKKVIEDFSGRATKINGNISEAILEFGRSDYVAYRNNLIVSASFNTNSSNDLNVTALYSSNAENSIPITLNLVSNTILKKSLGENYHIEVSRQKLPNVYSYKYTNYEDLVLNYVRALILILCLSPTFALYAVQSLKESSSGIKELQNMTGIMSFLYWASTFLYDFFFFFLTSVLVLLGFYWLDAAENLQLFHETEFSIMFLLLILFSINMLPFVYMFTFWKKKTNIVVTILTILPGLIILLEGIIFLIMISTSKKYFNEVLVDRATEKRFFMLVPSVSFFYGQHSFFETAKKNADCRSMPKNVLDSICLGPKKHMCCELNCSGGICEKYFKYFGNFESSESLEECLLYLGLTPIIYFLIIAILESKIIPKLIISLKKVTLFNSNKTKDDQVKAEKVLVASEIIKLNKQGESSERQRSVQMNGSRSGNIESNSIYLAYELSKYYGNLAAVEEISFSVKKKECFGLLGVNGAGKSTTFRILTGEEVPNRGILYLNGKGLLTNEREYLAQMGYCPQNSALIKSLNAKDHLELFASLRGVPRNQIATEVEKWIKRLKLTRCSNQPSGTYSGGNKRRLSIAMALIGNPNLVLMDEPTTGVDPAARRSLWRVIKSCQLAGQSIILTSHSMEECEALCNRVAIMVKGHFVCIGPSEQLKQKFGAGFDINIKLNPERTNDEVFNIKKDMKNSLQCELRDEHVGYITYHVMDSSTKWKTMYQVMHLLKDEYNCIEDFSILSATLEQLFLQFARADEKTKTVA